MINLNILKFLHYEHECSKKSTRQNQIKAGVVGCKKFGKLKSTIKKPTEVGHVYSI
jgi:hypothetical protein